jgi:uncharacterized BrkB/YihY/UPF0761 family membrane protein
MQYIIFFVVFVIIVLWGISVYLLKTKKLTAQEWLKRTLGIPNGSVRALIAFIILFLILCPVIANQKLPDLPDWLVGILGTVIGFYFGASTARTAMSEAKKSKTDGNDNNAETPAKAKKK